ncbi:hypothetical protein SERLADRAFT_432226 [Serpula lacrymans var. lacrymans S7.9]|uniref:Uncharacterized protein n=1 Tax=Serpula lacrymans var. lacrymans (strain S7.9) TaxID=578457 RepID=F8NEK4_SERL9|nr:uncharacterized protein SERLADRAFT_432226 [Serpula lacrymans var. lacrymans S7.9]EGO30638.1 hypothetical protein SERLADRAFT_432226 [Serpula lacrymans var. lacrymans S7.9]
MTKEETWDLLDHWYNQKNNINAKVIFRFKSTLHPVANKGKGKRKGKAAMKRVLPRVRMVAPRSNSTDEEQEEIKGPDKILSDDERGADVQNQPGPSEPAARQQTVAFQESTTRMGLGISLEGPGLAPSISGHQSVGVEEVDKDSPWHASITHKSKRGFLTELYTEEEYLKLVDAEYQLPKDKPGPSSQSNCQPEDYLDYWPL